MDGPAPSQESSRISASIEIGAPGKHQGYLSVPHSRNDSAWGSIQIPITSIANGEGPRLLFTAGSHGDEYEGQIALLKAARWLQPEMIQGQVILLPCLNYPAVLAASRLSPLDGLNMNRVFPGRRNGTPTEMIAHYVYHQLLPFADAVIDLHSGGKTLEFLPSAIMHDLPDPKIREETLGALRAFGAPFAAILTELDSEGMLDTAVERMGKIFLSTELGGAGMTTARSVHIAEQGVRNLLCHFGILQDDGVFRSADSRMLATPDAACFLISRHAGILEMLVEMGESVEAGQPVCQIHHFQEQEREASLYRAGISGILWCRHVPGLISQGDCMAVIACDHALE